MADDQQQGGKDPLAILEELLAKQKGQGGADEPATPAAPTGPTPEEEKAKRVEEYEKLKEEAAARDEVLIGEQEQQLIALKQSPQYQARVSQIAEQKDKDDVHKADSEGFEIVQLTTKKVTVPVDQS